jgi:hypothetical protein
MDQDKLIRLSLEEQKQKKWQPSEIAAAAQYLLKAERAAAEARRRANLKKGTARPEGETFPVRGRSLDRIGKHFDVCGRTLRKIMEMAEGGFSQQMDDVGLGRINEVDAKGSNANADSTNTNASASTSDNAEIADPNEKDKGATVADPKCPKEPRRVAQPRSTFDVPKSVREHYRQIVAAFWNPAMTSLAVASGFLPKNGGPKQPVGSFLHACRSVGHTLR